MNRELFAKFTFGFLMAVLFPGAIAVFSALLVWNPWMAGCSHNSLWACVSAAYSGIANSPGHVTVYLFLSVAAGMAVHGLNWAVVAWLESHKIKGDVKNNSDLANIIDSFCHSWPVGLQLLIGPVKMIGEMAWLLIVKGLDRLAVRENITRISPDKIPNFAFLQDFYLHFGQFYAHTAYALLVCTVCMLVSMSRIGWTWSYVGVAATLYGLTSLFFLVGRVQLHTLFSAEWELRDDA